MKSVKTKDLSILAISLISLVIINIISSKLFWRFDLTEEKRYTLSDQTISILENLEEEVTVTVYLEGDLNAGFVRLKKETQEMLDEFKAYAPGNLFYEFVDPYTLNKDPNKVFSQLAEKGLHPTNVVINTESGEQNQYLYPGAIVYYKNKTLPVQLLKSERQLHPEVALNKSIEAIEFEFSNTLRKLISEGRPKIAFSDGHGEYNNFQLWDVATGNSDFTDLSNNWAKGLSEYYQVFHVTGDTLTKKRTIELNRVNILEDSTGFIDAHALDGYDALIMAGPNKPFTDMEVLMIDQFIMKGGRVLFCMDGNDAHMDSLETGRTASAYPYNTKLHDLLFKYGARINSDIVQDINCGPVPVFDGYEGTQPRFQRYPWVYDPLIISQDQHLINTNLDPLKMNFASSIDTIPVPGIKKTVVLQTSPNTHILRTPARISLKTAVRQPRADQFKKGMLSVGVLLEGEFESAWKNRMAGQKFEGSEQFVAKSKPTKLLVISDDEFIKNEVTAEKQPYPLSVNKFYGDIYYDNKKFLLNAMNYLMDDTDLIPMRSRKIELRLLDKKEAKEDKEFWQLINLIGPLLIMVLIGFPLVLIRKIKYTK